MNAFAIGGIIMKLLPIIASAIITLEELDQSPGKGTDKLVAVKAIVKSIYEATNPAVAFDELANTIEKVIAALVTFYNAIGIFVKKAPAV